MKTKNIAIFASGSGTNARNIIEYFENSPEIIVKRVLSNREEAPVLQKAENSGVPATAFSREQFYGSDAVLNMLLKDRIDLVVLAGFLWLVPHNILDKFAGRIINIHPALLPRYGGKGMYGARVHEAVIASGDRESGITIHHVNEKYDEGEIIFQAHCPVHPDDTPGSLAQKIHKLEYRHYPEVIKKLLQNSKK